MSDGKVKMAMVGLGFGSEFISIYQAHPDADVVAICRRNEAELNKAGDQFGIDRRYTDFDAVLADPEVECVHINSPIADHAWMSLKALDAGKHVMCTVPMATTIEECQQICDKVKETGLKYMMAETVVYSREFLFIKDMYEKGELGKIQHLAASHPQDMEGWPSYWEEMIPMHYATHVVSPCLGLTNALAESVSCFGSGTVREEIAKKSGSPFAVQSCHIKLKDSDITAHIWRFLHDVARQYRESFDVYGTKRSFEWTLIENEPHVLHTAKKPEHEIPEKIEIPDFAHLLPEPIQRFTLPAEIHDADHLSFVQGGGHGGSHPHMVHEFVSAVKEDRDPWPNAPTAANWTCTGLCAHESAMKGGELVRLPDFS
ncbi:Gfo/Idh/MocA family protein [Rhodopirellula europaea]|uniref:Oxidoreductase domain protein n=2 Tax=Rhodopirellula europaea TaxID=1263866 RepID=M2B0T1_9BACT|nr:Gfo/Idh/MocA family oxidoreductase [Rhodopirellula europaea]EMB15854.1 oxidoreductase domain protein [Rhodopirellula europaea 6C]EMI28916.1 oxidoreductase domain protein [Rhodopirellula europaea SH398]MCR9209448.1 Gfo/Idh/MocA family oxidoreductase [bacterium]|tara:strand:+ start:5462 stop:6577 length:1116 start_codon:yes stop_codon:yes gene_type:complete